MLARPRPGRFAPLRSLLVGLLYRSGVTKPSRAGRGRLTVVTFHRVLPEALRREYPLPQLAVTVEQLASFASFFSRNYTCGTLASVHRRWLDGERPERPFLAITFDDGQVDNFNHARPVLDAAGVKATFFCPVLAIDSNDLLWHDRLAYAGRLLIRADRERARALLVQAGPSNEPSDESLLSSALQNAKRLSPSARLHLVATIEAALGKPARPEWDGAMKWDQLRTLVGTGHEVGSHSLSHPILPTVDDEQLDREIAGSKAELEARLGVPCESFCYPNGDHDDRVVSAVRRAGYLRAVTTAFGPNDNGSNAMTLTRCDIVARHVQDRSGGLSEARLAFRISPYFPERRT
jgi:peptidoglycan/xylan/chitin deacetylase (PgdA/CDA1 family)